DAYAIHARHWFSGWSRSGKQIRTRRDSTDSSLCGILRERPDGRQIEQRLPAKHVGVVSPKSLYIRCAQIGLGRGAKEGVYPQRYSTDRATKPQVNFSATRRAACLLGGGVVARSLSRRYRDGICSSLAPSLRPKSIAANV